MATRIATTTLTVLLGLGVSVKAGQVPLPASVPDIPISSRDSEALLQSADRVYTADQTSNTVSVFNPQTEKLLGVIRSVKLHPRT